MERILYQVKRTRNQKAQVLINMGLACLFYVAAFYAYEWYTDSVLLAGSGRLLVDVSLAGASIILFAFAFWTRRNPATTPLLLHQLVLKLTIQALNSGRLTWQLMILNALKIEPRFHIQVVVLLRQVCF